jgi:UDP-glucose 4-epimerase
MKTTTIIGANSYIARNLIATMSASPDKYQYTLHDRHPTQADGYTPYESIDILNQADFEKINFNTDTIFMFVGKTGSYEGFANTDTFIDINERSLLNLLAAHRNAESKARIIFPSTRLVYQGRPGRLKEDDIKEFKSIYAINKYSCEQYLEMHNHVFNIPYTIFRICVPYGTLIASASSYGTAEFMLNRAKQQQNISLYGDGTIRRTLTHIDDLCHLLLQGAFSDQCLNDVFNIGGEDYSLVEMARLIAHSFGVEVEFTPWPEQAWLVESGDTVFDSTKLETAIGHHDYRKFHEWCASQEQST